MNINRHCNYPHNHQSGWSICSGDIQLGWSQQRKNWGSVFAPAHTSWLSWCQFEEFPPPIHWCLVVQELKKENIMCIHKLCWQQLLADCWEYCISLYSPDLEPRNFHFCTSLMKHFEIKHFWHHDEMKAEVNRCVWRLRFYFLPAHFQHVCSGTSVLDGLLMQFVLNIYIS